jgi:hypothetical protein
MSVNYSEAIMGPEVLQLTPGADVVDHDGLVSIKRRGLPDHFVKEPPMVRLVVEMVTQGLKREPVIWLLAIFCDTFEDATRTYNVIAKVVLEPIS